VAACVCLGDGDCVVDGVSVGGRGSEGSVAGGGVGGSAGGVNGGGSTAREEERMTPGFGRRFCCPDPH
jgi:hypothetical protein